jgi:hypothetical protein
VQQINGLAVCRLLEQCSHNSWPPDPRSQHQRRLPSRVSSFNGIKRINILPILKLLLQPLHVPINNRLEKWRDVFEHALASVWIGICT